jgi:hypothetical protein
MPGVPTIHSSRIDRQMDHLIMALKIDPSRERPDFLLSLYWIGYTVEAGAPDHGHVAYLWSMNAGGQHGSRSARGKAGDLEAALTDNLDLAQALGPRLRPGQWPMSEPDRPVLAARFERQNLTPYGIGYRVTTDDLTVEARWEDLGSPVLASGPTRAGDAWIATMLVESFRPSAFVNGRPQPGRSFPNPIWRPWFGDERGSCILGLGETIYEARPEDPRGAGGDFD